MWGIAATLGSLLVAGAIWGYSLYSLGRDARDNLLAANLHVQEAQQAILTGDTSRATKAASELQGSAHAAAQSTSGWVWSVAEALPLPLTENLKAVRVVTEVVKNLSDEIVTPASKISLSSLAPSGGQVDLARLAELSALAEDVEAALINAGAQLNAFDTAKLEAPVAEGVVTLSAAIDRVQPMLAPAREILEVLPTMLGRDEARDYLLMFQGNSESRSLGGNAAVFMVLRAEAGRVSVVQEADSSDFAQPVDEPIVELQPETVALYGDKVGRWTPDFTMIPDFPEATRIALGWWKSEFATPISGVFMMDPVALSYLLTATGPLTLATGEVLSAENAAPLLLNEAYLRYEDPLQQNAFFSAAAGSVFTALTSGAWDPALLIQSLVRSTEEGRIMYWSDRPDEMNLVQGTRLSGKLPSDNSEATVAGVYFNDNTGSKKSYYLDASVTASAATCPIEAGGAVTVSATVVSSLTSEMAENLPFYITGPYFPAEEISTFVYLYGPVGATATGVVVDGAPTEPAASGMHNGRPVVKVNLLNHLISSHTVEASFALSSAENGPLAAWTTPMSRATPVTLNVPKC